MFNFKIDPNTKQVEINNSTENYGNTQGLNVPLTQADVSGDFKAQPHIKYSDWGLDDLEKKNKSLDNKEVPKENVEVTEDTSTQEQESTTEKNTPKTKSISAENETVIDDFGEGEID